MDSLFFFSLDMFTVFSLYYTHYRMLENQRGEINQTECDRLAKNSTR